MTRFTVADGLRACVFAIVAIGICAVNSSSLGAVRPQRELGDALRLDAEVATVRRCYNDASITEDNVGLNLRFTNVSPAPVAILPGVFVITRTSLWESGDGLARRRLAFELESRGIGNLAGSDPMSVIWPGESVVFKKMPSFPVLRLGIDPIVGVVNRLHYLFSVRIEAKISWYEVEEQPVSTARSVGFDSRAVPLDLSANLPIEFCGEAP